MSPMSQTIEFQRMEDDDDISALRDPYFGDEADSQRLHSNTTVGKSIFSSDRQLYEFGVRGGVESIGTLTTMTTVTTATGGTTTNNGNRTVFTDDGSLEEFYRSPDGRLSYENGGCCSDNFRQLTVVAPSGKMGIVIDNPTTATVGEGGGVPMIHAIKETSVLRGKIRVGDLLISVDDVDCRGMSATQVTRVISRRSGNAERTLVLLRGGASALGNC